MEIEETNERKGRGKGKREIKKAGREKRTTGEGKEKRSERRGEKTTKKRRKEDERRRKRERREESNRTMVKGKCKLRGERKRVREGREVWLKYDVTPVFTFLKTVARHLFRLNKNEVDLEIKIKVL